MSFEKTTNEIIDDLLDYLYHDTGSADLEQLDADPDTGFLIDPDRDCLVCPDCESIVYHGELECSVCGRSADDDVGTEEEIESLED